MQPYSLIFAVIQCHQTTNNPIVRSVLSNPQAACGPQWWLNLLDICVKFRQKTKLDLTFLGKPSFKSIVYVLSYCVKTMVSNVTSLFSHTLDWHHPMFGNYSDIDLYFVATKDS